MYFEDIEEGYTLTTKPQIITQDMIERFADLTGDHNPLHLDEDAAKAGPFGEIVSHGRLISDVAIGLLPYELIEGMMLLEDSTKYLRPVKPDDHIRSVFRVVHKQVDTLPESPHGFVNCEINILNQSNKQVAKMQFRMRAAKRPKEN